VRLVIPILFIYAFCAMPFAQFANAKDKNKQAATQNTQKIFAGKWKGMLRQSRIYGADFTPRRGMPADPRQALERTAPIEFIVNDSENSLGGDPITIRNGRTISGEVVKDVDGLKWRDRITFTVNPDGASGRLTIKSVCLSRFSAVVATDTTADVQRVK
jgi:hypothetical protein